MTDDQEKVSAETELLARRLARESGVTVDEARELIHLIGTDWSSLLREAHFLKGRH
ncbi:MULTISPECIES: hypothetical protein [unclassified Mesorhizobium]|uniref:hypothetical protein n=1 Tax=unclassified Mesorhizobium TaxID=325217 RepID=UPI0024169529|nr:MULTISPECIES: hypothetical protein [unclassified Mesorhizobium]WFP62206.1 hypothetical protein QAZ47_27725 [Mesorhizobium sp. WSM4904]WFP75479.1 hypothetical protein QAZ22_27820 [Mesorhizobium sp. WSM4906]